MSLKVLYMDSTCMKMDMAYKHGQSAQALASSSMVQQHS